MPSAVILSPFFFPEQISTGKYNTHLALQLLASGVRVSVVSSYPVFPAWKPEIVDVDLAGVGILRGGGGVRYPKSAILRRAVLELWFAWHVCSNFVRGRIKADIFLPIFPPSLFFLVLSLIASKRIRRVGIVHDLQGVYADRAKGLAGRLVSGAIRYVESRCFKACHRLVFLSKSMAGRAIKEYGLDPGQCVVCYPFVALPPESEQLGENLSVLFEPEYEHVVYSGALGDKQFPDGLYAFMDHLSRVNRRVVCHIFSAGPHFERLKELNLSAGNASLLFHDLVAVEDLDELYARSDIQVIPQEFGTGDGSLPSKLPNLMAAGVPVFVICEKGSELGELVVEAEAGVVANSWEPSDLLRIFNEHQAGLLGEARAMRKGRLRDFVIDKFNIQRVVDEILKA